MNDIHLGIKANIILTNEDWITLQTIKKILKVKLNYGF